MSKLARLPTMFRLRTTNILQMTSRSSKSISKGISVTCRGEPITHDELFRYTSGRFLVNERLETAKRYIKFDVEKLCELVSALPAISSPVSSVEKMEGGFNKALLMTMENGKEVIAKIPCAIVPSEYCTASEAATLEFVRSNTSIPVPTVLAWNSDASNPVGTEYIILEKAQGKQLIDVWGDMDEPSRFKLVQNLARLESQLATIEFPCYGNLYFRSSAPGAFQDLSSSVGAYCIGPAYNVSWPSELDPHSGNNRFALGPWQSLSELGLALAKRGVWNMKNSKRVIARSPHHGSPQEHIWALETAIQIIPILALLPLLQRHSKPTMWHTDLHMGNIFVSDEDPTLIVSLIDWQFTTVLPRFIQVRWPEFLSPPDHYEVGMVKPELPSNFDQMDSDEKAFVVAEKDQATRAKCYEAALVKNHLETYLALTQVDDSVRLLFTLCENTYKDGIVPLRDCLIKIYQNWDSLGLLEPCPVEITPETLKKHQEELSQYKDWLKLKGYTQELLCSDDDGWVPLQVDFDEVQMKHQELFNLYLQGQSSETSEEEARKLWFYMDQE